MKSIKYIVIIAALITSFQGMAQSPSYQLSTQPVASDTAVVDVQVDVLKAGLIQPFLIKVELKESTGENSLFRFKAEEKLLSGVESDSLGVFTVDHDQFKFNIPQMTKGDVKLEIMIFQKGGQFIHIKEEKTL